MTDARPLDGRHAVVTGGGRGIGAAIARRLAALGADVSLIGRTPEPLQALADELGDAHPQRFAAVPADVTDEARVEQAFAEARATLGPVAVLVNNAGAVDSVPFTKMEPDRWQAMLDVNLTSAYRCTRRALPDMLEAGWGRVVNIASTSGVTGYPYVTAYCAAKHGLVGLTRALALEVVQRGVTVNAVCPGYTDTDLVAGSVEALAEKTGQPEEKLRAAFEQQSPLGRMLRPEEVASAVAWLCHPEQAAVTAQALVIAGGEAR
jgi:NAD(P)-dependent dehydrogenase (short-subunit alcohol dehydrogenase family)